MLVYLKANPAAFDDGEVRILTAAFDKAWESVQAGGAIRYRSRSLDCDVRS
jgi:hypothetical protein